MLMGSRRFPVWAGSLTTLWLLAACGSVYTPQNMPRNLREETAEQQAIEISFVTMDAGAVRKANRDPYPRWVIDGSDLNGPGRLKSEASALHSRWPPKSKPQPYLIGPGDTLSLTRVTNSGRNSSLVTQTLRVSDTGHVTLLDVGRESLQETLPQNGPPPIYKIGIGDVLSYATIVTVVDDSGEASQKIQTQSMRVSDGGAVKILGVGEVLVSGLDLETAEREVTQAQLRQGIANDFQLTITGYRSKRFVVSGDYVRNGIFPYTNEPATLNDLLLGGTSVADIDTGDGMSSSPLSAADAEMFNISVRLLRDGQEYRFAAKRLLTGRKLFYIHPDDRIIVETPNLMPGLEPVRVAGMTTEQARKAIGRALSANNQTPRTEIQITDFASQKIYISGDVDKPGVYPFTDISVLIAEALAIAGMTPLATTESAVSAAEDVGINRKDKLVRLYRGGKSYRFSARRLIENPAGHYLQSGDRLVVEDLRYRSEQVIIAGAVPEQQAYAITAEDRKTLSDAIYATNALGSEAGDPSQIYVIRQTNKIHAYHIDTSNPARLLLAGEFELRPNDIVFIAEQPIAQFNRVLQALLTGVLTVRSQL